MLIKATQEDIEQYMELAYSLAMDQTRSGYPLFSDGISTKGQFTDHVWRGYAASDSDILLFVMDGAVEGWIQFFRIEQDRYLQTTGFLINNNTEQALTEFMEYAGEHFPGYDLYLGFPKKNSRAIAFLQKDGSLPVEEAYHDIFLFHESVVLPRPAGLVKVAEDNFSAFREIYQVDEDTYWTPERIFASLSQWRIYLLYRDGKAMGYVCARDGEIYSLGCRDNVFDKSTYTALVTAILRDLQAAGYTHMVFFNEEESQQAALDMGFTCAAEYVLYVKSV